MHTHTHTHTHTLVFNILFKKKCLIYILLKNKKWIFKLGLLTNARGNNKVCEKNVNKFSLTMVYIYSLPSLTEAKMENSQHAPN